MSRFSAQQAIAVARELLATRYPDAEFAIASGSIVRGHATDTSDLDLMVIYRTLKNAYREALLHDGMPVEIFVNDYETIQGYIDREHRNAKASTIHMLATGTAVPGENEAAKRLQRYALTRLEQGPPPPDPAAMEQLRYAITDMLDDLRGGAPPHELRAILYGLHHLVAELRLWQASMFVGVSGKHLARSLHACDAEFANRLDRVMCAGHDGSFGQSHIDELARLLDTLGGRRFEGYRQDAAADARSEAKWYGEKP